MTNEEFDTMRIGKKTRCMIHGATIIGVNYDGYMFQVRVNGQDVYVPAGDIDIVETENN